MKPFLYMQEQLCNLDIQANCPPPPKPTIKPQSEVFSQDQFLLQSYHSPKQSQKNSMEEQVLSFSLSEVDTESMLDFQLQNNRKSGCLKRSLRQVHQLGPQFSRNKFLQKLQRLDRIPMKKKHL